MSRISSTPSQPDVGVLIPAAGKGERMGGEPKQFRPIAGVPMLLRSLQPFARHPAVSHIVVALPGGVVNRCPEWLGSLPGDLLTLVAGGATRAESVFAALEVLRPACRTVLVHDAARPFVSLETIEAVIESAAETGAVPGVPVSDTIKRVDSDTGRIIETVDRTDLWRAQTPQGFPRAVLEVGYRLAMAGELGGYTDEASLIEAAGFPIRMLRDSAGNFKITTTGDLAVAEFLASR